MSSLVHAPAIAYKAPTAVMKLPVSGLPTHPLRDRADYAIDSMRGKENVYELAKAAHKGPPGMPLSPFDLYTSQTILAGSIDKGFKVSCPFPSRDVSRHTSVELHHLGLSFGVTRAADTLAHLLNMKSDVGVKNPGDPTKTMETIAFTLPPTVLRHLVSTQSVPSEMWHNEYCYQALPTLIQAVRVDSNLPGNWQMCLVAKPPMRGANVERSSQEFFIPSALGGFDGSALITQCPIRESCAGGTRANQILHKLDTALPMNPEFGRWLGVDFDRLEKTLEAQRNAHAPSAELAQLASVAHNQLLMASSAGAGTFTVIVPIPSDYEALCKQDLLSFEYIVFTEMAEVMRLEHLLRKPESGNWIARENFRLATDVSDKPVGAGPAKYMFINSSTLETIISQKKQLAQREKNLIRLDHLELHISPVNPKEWDTLLQHARYERGSTPVTPNLNEGCVRFSVDLSILYEPLCSPKSSAASLSSPRSSSSY